MSKDFTEVEVDILHQVYNYVDEVFVELRHGIAQNKYVFEVRCGSEYLCHNTFEDNPVPESLVGTWMMNYPANTDFYSLEEAIEKFPWERCELKEVTILEWGKVDDPNI